MPGSKPVKQAPLQVDRLPSCKAGSLPEKQAYNWPPIKAPREVLQARRLLSQAENSPFPIPCFVARPPAKAFTAWVLFPFTPGIMMGMPVHMNPVVG